MNPEWAQFWANVLALGVAIGLPWRLHLNDRAERARDKAEQRKAEQRDQHISALNLGGIAMDTYLRAGSLRALLAQLTLHPQLDDLFAPYDARAISGLLQAIQFRESTNISVVEAEARRLRIPHIAREVGRMAALVRTFDFTHDQQAGLLTTGKQRITALETIITYQQIRLNQVEASCRRTYDAVAGLFEMLSFDEVLALTRSASAKPSE